MHGCIKAGLFWFFAGLPALIASSASAEMIKGYPDTILCRGGDTRGIAYIAGVKDDGSAVYRVLSAEIYLTVTPDRVVHHHGSKDCDGKSLDQLAKDGQTGNFR